MKRAPSGQGVGSREAAGRAAIPIPCLPEPYAPDARPARRARQGRGALTRNARIEANGISIVTDGGKVILRGRVPRWPDGYVAEQTAWSAAGFNEVEDLLTVA